MDSDKILVLDAGQIKEYDEPCNLLENKESALFSLVQQTGPQAAENLFQIAKMVIVLTNLTFISSIRVMISKINFII